MTNLEHVLVLIRDCEAACKSTPGFSEQWLTERVSATLSDLDAGDFLKWVVEDLFYSSYYYDVCETASCAKPRELAAAVLEAIALDRIESLTQNDENHENEN